MGTWSHTKAWHQDLLCSWRMCLRLLMGELQHLPHRRWQLLLCLLLLFVHNWERDGLAHAGLVGLFRIYVFVVGSALSGSHHTHHFSMRYMICSVFFVWSILHLNLDI